MKPWLSICGALHDLVLFLQLRKREKHQIAQSVSYMSFFAFRIDSSLVRFFIKVLNESTIEPEERHQ